MNRKLSGRTLVALSAAVAAFGLAFAARAGNLTWTGATNNTWNTTDANWTGDATVFTTGDVVTFNDSGPGGTITVASVTPGSPVTVDNPTKNYNFTGSGTGLSGAVNLVKNGAGTLTLAGVHTFGGSSNTITINNGTVSLGVAATSVMGDASNTVVMNGGTIFRAGGGFTYGQKVSVRASSTFGNVAGSSLGFAGASDFQNNPTITVGLSASTNGSGTRTLSFNGPLTLTSGATFQPLTIGANTSNSPILFNGGIIQTADRTLTFNYNANTITFNTTTGSFNGAGTDLILAGATTQLRFGVITGATSQRIVIGDLSTSPLAEFNGSTSTTFSGGVKLASGTLRLGANAAPTGGAVGTGTFTLAGGTLTTTNAVWTVTNDTVLDGSNATAVSFSHNNNNTLNLSGNISTVSNPTLNHLGGATLNFGPVTLNSNATFGNSGGTNFNMNNGLTLPGNRTLTFTGTGPINLGGPLAGAYTLDIAGTGQAVTLGNLTGSATAIRVNDAGVKVQAGNTSATFSGGVILAAGTLQFNASSIGTVTSGPIGTGTLTLAGGTITTTGALSPTISNPITASGGNTTFVSNNDQTLLLDGGMAVTGATTLTFNNTNVGKVTLSGASSLAGDLNVAGTGAYALAGQFNVTGARTINVTNGVGAFTGGFTGLGSLTFTGPLTSINGGTSNYSGTTTIAAGATLRAANFNSAGGVDVLSPNSVYDIAATGKLDLFGFGNSGSGGRLQTVGGLTGAGTVDNANSAGNYGDAVSKLVINTTGNNTFNGLIGIANGIRVVVQGTGSQTFATANTYQDGTTINAAKLLVTNPTGSGTGSGPVVVNSPGTLGGTGTIAGATTVNAGATLEPGNNGVGTLTFGNTLSLDTAALSFELGATGDLIQLGAQALNAANVSAFTFTDVGGIITNSDYTLIDYGTFGGTLANFSAPGTLGAYTLSLVDTGSAIVVHVSGGAVTNQWTGPAGGNWGDSGKWTAASVPDANTAVARLWSNNTGAASVDLQAADRTVKTLSFDSGNAYDVTSTGGGKLILSADAGNASIEVLSGTHSVSAPISLASDTDVTIPAAGTLTVATIRGAQALNLNSGTLKLALGAGTSKVAALNIAGGTVPTATLDLTDNKLAIDYTGASVLPTVVKQLQSGRNGYDGNVVTNWDGKGIVSSKARTDSVAAGFDLYSIGAINNADLADPNIGRDTYTSFGGLAVDDSSVLLRYTYAGDADLNGFVDGDDYALIDNAFNLLIPNFGWMSGDFNYDGNIDGDDYALIDSGFLFQGAPIPAAAVSAVPEPTTLGVLALGAVGLLGRRRRA